MSVARKAQGDLHAHVGHSVLADPMPAWTALMIRAALCICANMVSGKIFVKP